MKRAVHSNGRDVSDVIHADCKHWRQLVTLCGQSGEIVPPAIEDHYRQIHARILATCRHLANLQSAPMERRKAAEQMDELLRPWFSTKVLKEAPAGIVTDLVKNQTILDGRLRGGTRAVITRRIKNVVLSVGLAVIGGAILVLLLRWASDDSSPAYRSLQLALASLTTFLRRSSFAEQFAVAVLFVWLVGTWLLSHLSRS